MIPLHRSEPAVNYLGLGVQKSGTTWLHRMLGAHPNIFVAQGDDKDLRFFSCFYDFGYLWYESYFSDADSCSVRGEMSTSYFYSSEAPERVRRYNPNMKLILSLRNPVDRLLSHHKHEIRIGHISSDVSVETGIHNNPSYVEQSMYFSQLSRWLKVFPLSQFHIIISEEMFRAPEITISQLYRFLGVDSEFLPQDLNSKVNVGSIPRYPRLDRALSAGASAAREIKMGWLIDAIKNVGLAHSLKAANTKHPSSATFSNDLRKSIAEFFSEDKANLSQLLSRDLSLWDE